MQDLIDRAAMHEDTDIEALRELAVTVSVEGSVPSPRVMTDGGHPRPTAGWRSPLGGPRYDGPIPGEKDPRVDEWREEQIESEIRTRREGEGVTAGPEDDGLRADGGEFGTAKLRDGEHRDDDNVHQLRNDEQHDLADEFLGPDLEEIHVGDHVRDRDNEDRPTMLVVGTPIEQADEYECKDKTVAESNPEYPADDDVLEVVFPSRCDVSTRPLDRYAFPRSRLEIEAAVHGDGGDE